MATEMDIRIVATAIRLSFPRNESNRGRDISWQEISEALKLAGFTDEKLNRQAMQFLVHHLIFALIGKADGSVIVRLLFP